MDLNEYSYFAGNHWRKAADDQVFKVHEPYSGKLFARVAAGSRADGRTAVDASREGIRRLGGNHAGIVNVNSPTVNDEIHAPTGGVCDSDLGRTGPRSPDDFSDVIWINSHRGRRQYPF